MHPMPRDGSAEPHVVTPPEQARAAPSPRIAVQADPFDTGAEMARLSGGRCDIGGIGCFVGTVRDTAGGRPIQSMTLEHYPGMTERALARIAADATARFDLLACTLIHRTGTLRPGEGIVLVLAAAPHRQAALDATGFLIDFLKTRAPFWKQEHFRDSGPQWVAARDADEHAIGRW